MALFPLYGGRIVGDIDLLNTELASVLGGEVMTLTATSRSNTSTEQAAFDAGDGYLFDASGTINNRVAAVRASTASQFPLYLADDGTTNYPTLFGSVIGTPVGLSTTGSNLGPSTAAASGKVSLWGPGTYAVTTDALASDFLTSVSTGAAAGLSPGASIGFTNVGKLAHASCSGAVAATGVGRFVEFESNPSLVNTPNRLVGATQVFTRIVLNFDAGMGVRTL